MDSITNTLSDLSLQDKEDDYIDHVRRLKQSYRKLAIDFTKLREENDRLKSENGFFKRLFARNQFEIRKLKREIYHLKQLID